MRPVSVVAVLLLFFSLALLYAAPVSSWAAPTCEAGPDVSVTSDGIGGLVLSGRVVGAGYYAWAVYDASNCIAILPTCDAPVGLGGEADVTFSAGQLAPGQYELWLIAKAQPNFANLDWPSGEWSTCGETAWDSMTLTVSAPPVACEAGPDLAVDSQELGGLVIHGTTGNAGYYHWDVWDPATQWWRLVTDCAVPVGPSGEADLTLSAGQLPPGAQRLHLVATVLAPDVAGDCGGSAEDEMTLLVTSPVPVIQSVSVSPKYAIRWDGSERWSECARVRVVDTNGWQSVSASVVGPSGTSWPGSENCSNSQNEDAFTLNQGWNQWDETTPVTTGSYVVNAQHAGGPSAAPVTATLAFWPPVQNIVFPENGSLVTNTMPTFQWEPVADAVGFQVCVQRWGPDGCTSAWRRDGLPAGTTEVQYNDDGQAQEAALSPGSTYNLVLLAFYGDQDPSPVASVSPGTQREINFAVGSPEPQVQSVSICRGRWAKPWGEEVVDERVRAAVTDMDGLTNLDGSPHLSITATDPEGRALPYPDGCASAWEEGPYTLSQGYGGAPLEQLVVGPFTVEAEDSQQLNATFTTGDLPEPPPVQEITSPLNGSVLPEAETMPTFAWQPAEGAPPASSFCLCVVDTAGGDPVWAKPNMSGEARSATYNDDGQARLEGLLPGHTYQLRLRAWYPDSDPDDAVTVTPLTERAIEFTIYSPVPVIKRLEVRRGRSLSADGAVSYQDYDKVFVTDMEGGADVAAVSMRDSRGDLHDAWKVCDQDADTVVFCWQSWGQTDPSPAGTYTVTATDWGGKTASASAQVSAVPTDLGYLPLLTPANYVTTTAAPEFSWVVPLGVGCHCLFVSEVDGACQLWCPPGPVSSPLAYSGTPLLASHLYQWSLWSQNPDDTAQSDPAGWSGFLWNSAGRFWVEPKFAGFLEPINDDGSSIFKLGSTIPVKFQLVKADGSQITDASCQLHIAKVTDNVTGTELEIVGTSAADSGNTFRYTTDHYHFDLGTKPFSKGTYRLWVTIDGATVHESTISLQ